MSDINLLWAKTLPNGDYYPLLAHMVDASSIAKKLYHVWLRPEIKTQLKEAFNTTDDYTVANIIGYVAGLHDLGKANPVFQGQLAQAQHVQNKFLTQRTLLESKGYNFDLDVNLTNNLESKMFRRHEQIGAYAYATICVPASFDYDNTDVTSSWVMTTMLGHHGTFKFNEPKRRPEQALTKILAGKWEDTLKTINSVLHSLHDDATIPENIPPELVIILSGITILADRLASTEICVNSGAQHYNSTSSIEQQELINFIGNQNLIYDLLIQEELGVMNFVPRDNILGDYSPRAAQLNIPTAEDDTGLWFIMAPTGTGKTEAALLRHANKPEENLIFLLPTQSTTSAMLSRFETVFKDTKNVTAISHGGASLEDFYAKNYETGQGLHPSGFARIVGAKLAAPVTTATIDQLVIAGLSTKWTHLRLLTLANSHIVIDEGHLLDYYQIEILTSVVEFLKSFNVRITVLSATLPTNIRNEIVESYGLETETLPSIVFPTTEHHPTESEPVIKIISDVEPDVLKYDLTSATTEEEIQETHTSWAVNQLKQTPNARLGIFVNQINRAQNITEQLQQHYKNDPNPVKIICFHSRMLQHHKQQIKDQLMEELHSKTGTSERLIIIGTQVIEMSLDIDLDFISTDICPAPNLIQRTGRLRRNKTINREHRTGFEQTTPPVNVVTVTTVEEDTGKDNRLLLPYATTRIQRTVEWLTNHSKQVDFPAQVQSFIEKDELKNNFNEFTSNEEAYEMLFQTMQGKNRANNYADLLNSYTTVTELSLMTNPEGQKVTRLIEDGQTIPVILLSSNPSHIQLGAIPLNSNLNKLTLEQLKKATISLSGYMVDKLGLSKLNDKPENPYIIEETDIGYDLTTGLVVNRNA